MGFTIETYQLLGLPPLPNIYVSIKGSYAVKKQLDTYIITFTVYYSASPNDPVITQKDMSFSIQVLPSPANLYIEIYQYIKSQLDPYYVCSSLSPSDQHTLTFTDD